MNEHAGWVISNQVQSKLFVVGGDGSCSTAVKLKRDVETRSRAYELDADPSTAVHHDGKEHDLDYE